NHANLMEPYQIKLNAYLIRSCGPLSLTKSNNILRGRQRRLPSQSCGISYTYIM
ncbi:unnamed protein product, partial [Dovyalis caffra]